MGWSDSKTFSVAPKLDACLLLQRGVGARLVGLFLLVGALRLALLEVHFLVRHVANGVRCRRPPALR